MLSIASSCSFFNGGVLVRILNAIKCFDERKRGAAEESNENTSDLKSIHCKFFIHSKNVKCLLHARSCPKCHPKEKILKSSGYFLSPQYLSLLNILMFIFFLPSIFFFFFLSLFCLLLYHWGLEQCKTLSNICWMVEYMIFSVLVTWTHRACLVMGIWLKLPDTVISG